MHTIKCKAFCGCSKLKTIQLPDTVKKIEKFAFCGCWQLEEINLPTLVEEVGTWAFGDCPRLLRIGGCHGDWTNSIHYSCDLARGGRQFLVRRQYVGDGDQKGCKYYHPGLWPMIIYRAMTNINLPFDKICNDDDDTDCSKYTFANPSLRRASVIYFLMVNGTVTDLS